MNNAVDMPWPIALVICACLLAGAFLALMGALGTLWLKSFYQRVHAPTLGSSMGMALILTSSILYFSTARAALVVHELIIAVFLTLTTPISLTLVVRALARDRREGRADVQDPPHRSSDQQDAE
jgi:multicomponent K+:H+ antiporter subunit G